MRAIQVGSQRLGLHHLGHPHTRAITIFGVHHAPEFAGLLLLVAAAYLLDQPVEARAGLAGQETPYACAISLSKPEESHETADIARLFGGESLGPAGLLSERGKG
ncbi:MAG: hypothetical protein ACT4OG_10640 [Alphaproteobacteria bacterium]